MGQILQFSLGLPLNHYGNELLTGSSAGESRPLVNHQIRPHKGQRILKVRLFNSLAVWITDYLIMKSRYLHLHVCHVHCQAVADL